jgi:hypothetical protein
MIIVKIMGGIASQLHKYAVGRALSLKYSVPLLLDLTWFESRPLADTPWPYQLGEFAIKAEVATASQIRELKGAPLAFRVRNSLYRRFGINLHKHTYIDGDVNIAQEKPLGKGFYISGEWVGEKYFSHIRDTLKQELTPSAGLSNKALDFASQISSLNSVSVHVRRGDYLSNEHAAKFHSLCGRDYYDSCIEVASSKISSAKYFLFSDDKNIALDMFKEKQIDIVLVEGVSDIEEFYLMSLCRHNICANSGFSWLAAWLGGYSDQVVIAPTNWLQDASMNSQFFEKIFCPGWIYLDN